MSTFVNVLISKKNSLPNGQAILLSVYGQRRTRTGTLSRMILSQLRLPIPPVALIHSFVIIPWSWAF
jgi:hypothetical protein